MLKIKKGQGLSLNMVIVAAIALIVLVIIVAIFTGRISIFGKGVGDCASKQGTCVVGTTCPAGQARTMDTCPTDQVCCVSAGA